MEKVGKEKRPYFIGMASGEPFAFAGVWENWKDPASGEWVRTFTNVTTEANELVRELHNRMPVVIGPEDRDRWLTGSDQHEQLKSYPSDLMTMRPVPTRVNSPRNDDLSLLDVVEHDTERSSGSNVKGADEAASAREPTNSE